MAPILYGLACPKGSRQGAGTSMSAPIAPPPQPTIRRRVTLPLYQKSCAHSSSFHFSVIACSPSESRVCVSAVARMRERRCKLEALISKLSLLPTHRQQGQRRTQPLKRSPH